MLWPGSLLSHGVMLETALPSRIEKETVEYNSARINFFVVYLRDSLSGGCLFFCQYRWSMYSVIISMPV